MRKAYVDSLAPGKGSLLRPIHDNHICALDVTTSQQGDACQGDSGGPLMYYNPDNHRFYLIGVVSGGFPECGADETPTLYSLLKNFMDLVESTADKVKICSSFSNSHDSDDDHFH